MLKVKWEKLEAFMILHELSDGQMARKMSISGAEFSRVKARLKQPGRAFIIGALKATEMKFEEIFFYLNDCHRATAIKAGAR